MKSSPFVLATFAILAFALPPAAAAADLPVKAPIHRAPTASPDYAHQAIKPYQRLRYWSTVPFRFGPTDVVKHSATPTLDNPAAALQRRNPKGLQDELIRHLNEDKVMSAFDFGLQLLDVERMTYWGKRQDANFWIENASIPWNEAQAPFHTVARLTLQSKSQLQPDAAEATYIDVTGNSTPDSAPLGSINRARRPAELASRKARMRAEGGVINDAAAETIHHISNEMRN